MSKAAELHAEVRRMREIIPTITDPDVVAELHLIIHELERRAREYSNGDGGK